MASFVLLQRGYETECIAVTRIVLERVAGAVVLFDSPDAIPKFVSGDLPKLGTRVIGPASKVVPELGRMWRLCSELGSHISKDNVGTGFLDLVKGEASDELHMVVGGRFPSPNTDLHAAWDEFLSHLCSIAETLLAGGVDQILFSDRRVRSKFHL